jgi:hypothetical protein
MQPYTRKWRRFDSISVRSDAAVRMENAMKTVLDMEKIPRSQTDSPVTIGHATVTTGSGGGQAGQFRVLVVCFANIGT